MENIKKAYVSGIFYAIFMLFLLLFNFLRSFDFGYNLNFLINFLLVVVNFLGFVFGLRFLRGFLDIGKKYSKMLKKATISLIGFCFLFFGVVFFKFLVIDFAKEQVFYVFFIVFVVLIVLYGILNLVFGFGIRKLKVKSYTKSLIVFFSVLESLSIFSVFGLFLFPYFFVNNFIFKILFLFDTYKKDHENKFRRNRLIWISFLVLYGILLVGVCVFVFYNFEKFNFDFFSVNSSFINSTNNS